MTLTKQLYLGLSFVVVASCFTQQNVGGGEVSPKKLKAVTHFLQVRYDLPASVNLQAVETPSTDHLSRLKIISTTIGTPFEKHLIYANDEILEELGFPGDADTRNDHGIVDRLGADHSPTFGSKGSSLTINAFVDFQCLYCKHAFEFLEKRPSSDQQIRNPRKFPEVPEVPSWLVQTENPTSF